MRILYHFPSLPERFQTPAFSSARTIDGAAYLVDFLSAGRRSPFWQNTPIVGPGLLD